MARHSIGLKIKEAREAKGWTQSILAEEAGVSMSLIGMVESGKSNPSLKALDKIAKALGKDPALFMATENTVPLENYKDHLTLKEKALVAQKRPWITLASELDDGDLTPDEVREVMAVYMKMKKGKEK